MAESLWLRNWDDSDLFGPLKRRAPLYFSLSLSHDQRRHYIQVLVIVKPFLSPQISAGSVIHTQVYL